MKPHVLVTEVSTEESHYISHALSDMFVVTTLPDTLAGIQSETLASVNVLVPFIHSMVRREEMEMMPNLRLIATRSTGYDHIDLKSAVERSIAVTNVPGYGENAVAECTFALILTLTRKIHLATTRTQQGDYTLAGLRGIDLYGKTLGVIGTGAIGMHVIRIAKGFGMNVLAYDVRQNRQLSEVLGFHYVSLDELLPHADIVTLHAPATPTTYHLMKKETFSQMKRGSFLINTARGSLVDVQALAWALDTRLLAGAGLDTLEGEEFLQHEEELLQEPGTEEKLKLLVQHHVLQRHSNVVITPHIAFNTEEALQRIQDTTIENVRSFFLGHPQNLVMAS
ncbi:MAG: hydroxyacid dehydrogenase [Ktedonobacteraceae bacterium]|nr:hydroxyacid dehydrogenase [Ktedonobacteraceae bacterium]